MSSSYPLSPLFFIHCLYYLRTPSPSGFLSYSRIFTQPYNKSTMTTYSKILFSEESPEVISLFFFSCPVLLAYVRSYHEAEAPQIHLGNALHGSPRVVAGDLRSSIETLLLFSSTPPLVTSSPLLWPLISFLALRCTRKMRQGAVLTS